MKTKNKEIEFETKEQFELIDLTKKVNDFVSESKIQNGLINIQSMHTTASVFVNENEPLLLKDIKILLEKIAPKEKYYHHDDFDRRVVNIHENEPVNGHSHCKALFLPTSVCLNIVDGKLQMGEWQNIFFIELDNTRNRKIQLQIIGQFKN